MADGGLCFLVRSWPSADATQGRRRRAFAHLSRRSLLAGVTRAAA